MIVAACGGDDDQRVAVPGANDRETVTTVRATTTSSTSTSTTTPITTTTVDPPATLITVPPTLIVTTPPPLTTTTIEIEYLRRGDEGPRVQTMQEELIVLGYLSAGSATGVFDGATADALVSFQGDYGLIVDGVFGPETDRSLTAAALSVDPNG